MTAALTRRSTGEVISACTFCSTHNHGLCVGDCDCGRRAHVPDVETAARMRTYERPDLASLPVETRASQYHRKDEQR